LHSQKIRLDFEFDRRKSIWNGGGGGVVGIRAAKYALREGVLGGGRGINSSIFIALVGFDLHRPIGLSVPTEPTTYVGRTKFGRFSVSESTQGEV
jgi:hypothetical protein